LASVFSGRNGPLTQQLKDYLVACARIILEMFQNHLVAFADLPIQHPWIIAAFVPPFHLLFAKLLLPSCVQNLEVAQVFYECGSNPTFNESRLSGDQLCQLFSNCEDPVNQRHELWITLELENVVEQTKCLERNILPFFLKRPPEFLVNNPALLNIRKSRGVELFNLPYAEFHHFGCVGVTGVHSPSAETVNGCHKNAY